MPRGYRSIISTVAGLAVLAALLFFLIRDLSSVDSAYSHAATDASVKYQGDASAYIEERCFSPAGLREEDCAANAREAAREGQRKEQDLAAQNITAWWTKVMGIAALIGMALSMVGVYLVKTTFDETREANTIARNAQRAWVTLKAKPELIRRADAYGLYIRVKFIAENIGSTAAIDFDICHAILFRGQAEKSDSIVDRIDEYIEQWREEYGDMGNSHLLPKDTETSDIWDDFTAEEIQWWGNVPVIGKAAQPMLLCAVFYKTVDHPDVVQLSWRAWYLNVFDSDGVNMTLVPFNRIPLKADEMCVDPYHASLMHAEYKADKSE